MGTLNQKNKNKQDDETEIDLGKLFKALMRRLPIILLVTLCFSAIGFSYGKYYLPLEYTSSTYMYVKNGDTSEEKTAINQQDLMASKSLVETYIVILKNDTVVKQVGMSLVSKFGVSEISKCFTVKNGVISTSELKDAISMSADGDTEVLKISAQTKDPHVSAEICDIYAEVAPTFLIRIIGAGSVEVIGDAEVPQSPSAPDVQSYFTCWIAPSRAKMTFSLSPSPIWAKCRKWWRLAAENGNAARKRTALPHCGICCSVQKIFRSRARKLTAPSAPT